MHSVAFTTLYTCNTSHGHLILLDKLTHQPPETQYDQHAESTVPPTPPPGLKEISSLASWTVSSSKPGCGVGALRAPTTTTYWQSDGPQPHWLNIHFFKMVSICAMRIHLDYASDESYTPSRIEFYAGTHAGDLQLWSELQVREPRGWLTVDFSGVGDLPEGAENWEEDDEFDVEKLPILRCMLLQLKICENHQNGKDTHLRGLQILAKDGQAKTKANNKAHIALSQGSSFDMPVRTKKKDMDWDFLGDFDSMPTIR